MSRFRTDILVIISILFLIIVVYLLTKPAFGLRTRGDAVRISVNGKPYAEYSLKEDRELLIDEGFGRNLIRISEGYVQIIDADCPDGLCVKAGSINHNMEQLICLPNRLVVSVLGSEGGGLDAIAY